MASWAVSANDLHKARVLDECVDVARATRFGAGASALRPLEGAPPEQRRSRKGGRRPRLGELLVAEGLLTDVELAAALAEQRRRRPKEPLGETLMRQGLVPGTVLVRLLSKQCEVD